MKTTLRCCLAALCVSLAPALVAPNAYAKGAPIAGASDEQKAEAGKFFREGDQAMAAGRMDEALEKFRASYNVVASPNTHLMIVVVLQDLGRLDEAYNEVLEAVMEADQATAANKKYAPTAEQARGELLAVQGKVARLVVSPKNTSDQTTVMVNDRVLDRKDWGREMAYMPGKLIVVVDTAGKKETRTVEVAAGDVGRVQIDAPPGPTAAPTEAPQAAAPVAPEAPPEPVDEGEGLNGLQIGGIVATGVGVVGLGMFGIFGGLHLSEFDKFEGECAAGCGPERSGEADDGRTFQTVANTSLIIGAVGVAAGVGMLIGGSMQGGDSSASVGVPKVAVGPGSISVSGVF
jgi:hypothetical protein